MKHCSTFITSPPFKQIISIGCVVNQNFQNSFCNNIFPDFSDPANIIPIPANVRLATTVLHPFAKAAPLPLLETLVSTAQQAFERPEPRPKIEPSVAPSLDRARSPSEVILVALTAFTLADSCTRVEV